jgi:hypothetical protein
MGPFEGFEGYQIPSPTEIDEALRTGLVMLDTNALLNLYRYTERTRDDLFRVLESLGDRLWVPHQVMLKFWRNRLSALGNPATAAAQAKDTPNKSQQSAVDAIDRWAKQVALGDDQRATIQGLVSGTFEKLQQIINEGAPGQVDILRSTDSDPILERMAVSLAGHVGRPMDSGHWKIAVEEGRRRVDALEPPGYLDADKADSHLPEGPAGDYLVWAQLKSEGRRRDCDVVLVTGDEKEDWWWRYRSHLLGPRAELVEEYLQEAGHRLFMLTPRDLLARSGVLHVSVAQESVEDVARVGSEPSERPSWTLEGVMELLRRLDFEGREQADVIRAAAAMGGRIDRDSVYGIADYSDDRMLRGFTRPAARITSDLQYEGLVPDGVTPMLEPIYHGVRAAYFKIPSEVTELMQSSKSVTTPGRLDSASP